MNCREAIDLLEPLLDGALDREVAQTLEKHLDACPACREEWRKLSATVELIRDIPSPPAPDGFAEEVLARLPARAPARRRGVGRLLRFAPIAAAAVLLLTAVLLMNRERPGREQGDFTDVATRTTPEKLDRAGKPRRQPPGMFSEGEGMEQPRPAEEAADGGGDDGLVGAAGRRSAPIPPEPAPAGASAPGSREPMDPEPPGDSPPSTALPEAPGHGDADNEHDEGEPAVDRRYVLSGVAPDAVAGQIWAELVHLRRAGGEGASKSSRLDAPESEAIVSDADGEPSRMLVCLTEVELDLIAELVRQRPGASLLRTNGIHHPGAARDKTANVVGRVRVEILLRR